ncbi:PaaI family thioesterase [Pseudorhodobacter turbinis]|nr:PaaI family thioesterase [Pseudorhodobacter turbinis]
MTLFTPKSLADIPSRETLFSMSGLEFLQATLEGRLPHAAIATLMNAQLASVAPGRVTFRATPAFEHTNPVGAVHGGWYGTLLDSAFGCAVMTSVPKGKWYTTLEYKVNITRALPLGMEVIAEGILDHSGRSTATAHATVKGAEDGKLYASGTTTCIILDR